MFGYGCTDMGNPTWVGPEMAFSVEAPPRNNIGIESWQYLDVGRFEYRFMRFGWGVRPRGRGHLATSACLERVGDVRGLLNHSSVKCQFAGILPVGGRTPG